MSYANIGDGAFIDYLGGRWRYQCRQDHTTEWRQSRTFEHVALTDRELQRLINRGELRLYNGDGRKPSTTRATSSIHGQRSPSKADWEEAGRKLLFVQAIHAAGLFHPGASVADWELVITDVFRREGTGWNMLRGKNKGRPMGAPVYKSVRRWVVAGGTRPTLEKMMPRHRFKGNYSDRIHIDLRNFIAERVQRDYLQRPAITIESLQVIIHIEMKELNDARKAAGNKPFPLPGLKAIQSSIDAVPKDEVLRRRYGEMAAFLSYGSAEAQADPVHPLDRVELDSTPCDLFVIDPDTGLPIGRPTLVVALDRCTRMVLGWFVTFEKPSIHALMQCLRNAILEKDYLDQVKEEQGWNILNDPETFGVPHTLVLDRARENIAEQIARFAMRAGISRIQITGGKKPWMKGAVERVIKTISERVLHPAKGTTLHNVLKRMDYDSVKDAVCTPSDLDYALHKYFIDIYPFEPRRSLNNRQPIKLWRELTRKHPIESIGSIEEVAHLFGRTDFAKPGRHGLNYENMQYFSSELLEAQRSSQFQAALKDQGGKLEFHINPGDLSQIQVRLPHVERVIDVPVAPKWRKYATGLSIWHHKRIREWAGEEARGDADALLQAKYDLMEIMKGSGLAKRGGLRARGMGARMEGAFRFARAGTDASTSATMIKDQAARLPDTWDETPANDADDPSHTDHNDPDDDHAANGQGEVVRRRARKGYRG